MKKIFILLVFILLVVGCSTKIDIVYDINNKVIYAIEDDDHKSGGSLTIYLDPQNKDVVSKIVLNHMEFNKGYLDKNTVESLMSHHNSSLDYIDQFPSSYIYQSYERGNMHEKNSYLERIIIELYQDGVVKDCKDLFEYMGLTSELSDGVLYYEDELLKSDTFRYQYFLDGEMIVITPNN